MQVGARGRALGDRPLTTTAVRCDRCHTTLFSTSPEKAARVLFARCRACPDPAPVAGRASRRASGGGPTRELAAVSGGRSDVAEPDDDTLSLDNLEFCEDAATVVLPVCRVEHHDGKMLAYMDAATLEELLRGQGAVIAPAALAATPSPSVAVRADKQDFVTKGELIVRLQDRIEAARVALAGGAANCIDTLEEAVEVVNKDRRRVYAELASLSVRAAGDWRLNPKVRLARAELAALSRCAPDIDPSEWQAQADVLCDAVTASLSGPSPAAPKEVMPHDVGPGQQLGTAAVQVSTGAAHLTNAERDDVIEECAKVCDVRAADYRRLEAQCYAEGNEFIAHNEATWRNCADAAEWCAKDVRSLKSPPPAAPTP